MRDVSKLRVWQRAESLATMVDSETARLDSPSFVVVATELRTAARSIAREIAQGAAQSTRLQFVQHLSLAITAAYDTQRHLSNCVRVRALTRERQVMLELEVQEIRSMLFVLRRRVLEHRRGGHGEQ